MPEWLVALLSSGATLLVAFFTTSLNAKHARESLSMQLASQERVSESKIMAERERAEVSRVDAKQAQLFEHWRTSAMEYLSALNAYTIQSAKMLGFLAGAKYVFVGKEDEPRPYEIRKKAESEYSVKDAQMRLVEALSAVNLYFPAHIARHASRAADLELEWVLEKSAHYLEGGEDPGPHPNEPDVSRTSFNRLAQQQMGVEPPPVAEQRD